MELPLAERIAYARGIYEDIKGVQETINGKASVALGLSGGVLGLGLLNPETWQRLGCSRLLDAGCDGVLHFLISMVFILGLALLGVAALEAVRAHELRARSLPTTGDKIEETYLLLGGEDEPTAGRLCWLYLKAAAAISGPVAERGSRVQRSLRCLLLGVALCGLALLSHHGV